MTSLPLDVLGEIIGHTDLPTALCWEILSHDVLLFVRNRVYRSIRLTSQNIRPFVDHALPLLRFTRAVEVSTGTTVDVTPLMRVADIICLLRAILDHSVLESFNYQGAGNTPEIRELALHISRMSSLQWLGLDIFVVSPSMAYVVDLLSASNLRRLNLVIVNE
ncbi:hypothetical protein DL96DRAFT_1716362 [Flagelloscypha sp. PMI_526]|nr:hypothetical protein DL96DRAFT_1716362 [Flagelloscypha sp. PMI_526]